MALGPVGASIGEDASRATERPLGAERQAASEEAAHFERQLGAGHSHPSVGNQPVRPRLPAIMENEVAQVVPGASSEHPGTTSADRSRMLEIETRNRLQGLDPQDPSRRPAIKQIAVEAYAHPDANVATVRMAAEADLSSSKAARCSTLRGSSGAAPKVVQRALDGVHGSDRDAEVREATDGVAGLRGVVPSSRSSPLACLGQTRNQPYRPAAMPGLPAGPLIRTSSGERMNETFVPTKTQLESGHYWIDRQASQAESSTGTVWHFTPDLANMSERGPSLIDTRSNQPLAHNFVPTTEQQNTGQYWKDNQSEQGGSDWYYLDRQLKDELFGAESAPPPHQDGDSGS